MTHNGWTGFGDAESAYATWNVALWVDNTYDLHIARVVQGRAHGRWTAERVEAFCRSLFPGGRTCDMQARGIRADRANWAEIAEAWNCGVTEDGHDD